MADTETGWTKDTPTIDGVYWWRWPQNGQQIAFEVYGGKVFLGMQEQHPPTDGEWLGPISPADFEQLTRLREAASEAEKFLAWWVESTNPSPPRGVRGATAALKKLREAARPPI